ncbi:MAG: ADP-ribosylglycohydrolase family protein [Bacillota bacterium]|nr:ADP-ribosylglycohydrolase family protein [Bacillota bacterium]
MLGAMIGDIVGSIYEFEPIKTKEFPFWGQGCFFTDDTVMTAAVAKALLESCDLDHSEIRSALIRNMQEFGALYPNAGYGLRFERWLCSEDPQPYNSWGNGSAMRVSSAGWLCHNLEETMTLARLSAEVTHNHPEGVKGAQAVAAAIYLLRTGKTKQEVKRYIQGIFQYDFRKKLVQIRPDYGFEASCQRSVPQAMTAFWESESFEDCIRNAISLGGDSDTLGAIAGSLAEAYYGIPEDLKHEGMRRLDERILSVYQDFLNWRL